MINADLTYAVKMFVHHDIFRGLLCLNQRKMKRTCQIQVPKPKLNHLFLTIFYSKKTHISVAQFITTDLILTCKNMIYTCFFSPHWSPNTSGKTVSVSYRGHSWSGDGSLDKSVFLGHGGLLQSDRWKAAQRQDCVGLVCIRCRGGAADT